MRISPLVLMSRSGSGCPAVYRSPAKRASSRLVGIDAGAQRAAGGRHDLGAGRRS